MLWHADIQNITVDVTFRRKATGFGITSCFFFLKKEQMTKKQKAKQYKRVRTLVLNTPIKANSVCYMSFFFFMASSWIHTPATFTQMRSVFI